MSAKHCPVCDASSFTKVVVTLPSGQTRETEFVSCRSCGTVFFDKRYARHAVASNAQDFAAHVPPEVVETIASHLPDATASRVEMASDLYRHPRFGQLCVIFKREPDENGGQRWTLLEVNKVPMG